ETTTSTHNRRTFLLATSSVFALTFAFSVFADGSSDGLSDVYGPLYKAAPQLEASPRHGPRRDIGSLRRWNQISIDASGLDHTPPAPGENRVYAQQLGPCRASRAIAIVHV